MQQQFFVGMGKFEDLLDKFTDPLGQMASPELLLTTCIETLPSGHPSIRLKKFSVVAAIVDGGVCYYWRYAIGSVDDWGEVSRGKIDAAQGLVDKACELLTQYATAVRQFRVIKALVATPKDYNFLDGDTELIRYDKEAKTFVGTSASGHEAEEEAREAATA